MSYAQDSLNESGLKLNEHDEARVIELMANYALAALMDSSIAREAEGLCGDFNRDQGD